MSKVSGLGLPPPSSDHQTDGPGPFGGKLKAARSYHWQTDQFGDDGCEPAEPQRFFEGFEDIFLADRFDIDDAIWVEADLGQRWGKKIRASETPNHLALGAGRDTGNKKRGCGPINRPCPASGEFVDRAICQSAGRKPLIDLGNTKWQDRFRASHRAFEMLDAVSKIGNDGVRAVLRHLEPSQYEVFISLESEYVLYLFLRAM
ncbi:hypothetical protein HA462_02470 [Rhizobium leguminosarum bv. trifolii]|jgi:hypothetical protein|nr:hypothetical protein HA462_02470 [Rhizobium leguminosarum bv. trifolii]